MPKAALKHVTGIMAEHADGGVRINAVAPGLVASPCTEQSLDAKQAWELVAPLHRVATAEDISDACLALVATRYVTGQTLLVDGGLALMI